MDETWNTPDDWTLFGAQRWQLQFLSQARCVCVPRLWTYCTAQMCIVSGCPVYTSRWFSGIPSRKPEITTISRMMRSNHGLQLVCHWEFCHCDVEDEGRCPRISPWLSVVPPSSFPIHIAIEVSQTFELLILSLKLLLFWKYRSQRLLRFRQVSVLHFKGIVKIQRQILVAVEEAFEAHQHSNEKNPMFGVL